MNWRNRGVLLQDAATAFPAWGSLAATGALTAHFGYPPSNLWPLAFLGPVLLLTVCARQKPLMATISGLAYGLGFFLTLIRWLVGTIHDYGGIHIVLSVTAFVLLSAKMALYPALAGRIVSHVARRSGDLALLLFAPLWVGFEWARSDLVTGFGWGDLSQPLWEQGWLLTLAPRIGAPGVGLLMLWVFSAAGWFLLSRAPGPPYPTRRSLAVSGVAFALIVLLRFVPDGLSTVTEAKSVLLVQGNIAQSLKWDAENTVHSARTYQRLTLEATAKGPVDLVVWPETAASFYFQDQSALSNLVRETAIKARSPIVFGSPAYENAPGGRKYYNSVYAVTSAGETVGRYDKMRLVPFGEYTPFQSVLFFVKRMVYGAGDFTAGTVPGNLDPTGDGFEVGPLICFESTFPQYGLMHATGGARVLALVTNDAWFGATGAPWQHLAYASWRAAETGLPVLRAANTGISAVIDREGRVAAKSELDKPAVLSATVEVPLPGHPLAALIAPLVGPVCLFLALAGFFAILRLPVRMGR